MAKRKAYYVHYNDDGYPTRVAKIENACCSYGWENGRWVSMPGLLKITFDVTADYDDITAEEAKRLVMVQRLHELNLDKPGGFVYYIKPGNDEERERLLDFLEEESFKYDAEGDADRNDVLYSKFPINVNIYEKTIGHLGNVTCAACSANYHLSVEEFKDIYGYWVKVKKKF